MNKPRMEIIDNGYKPERKIEFLGYRCKICGKYFVLRTDMEKHLKDKHGESVVPFSFEKLVRYGDIGRARA